MEFGEIFHNLIFDYTLRTVALGSGILGIISGALGGFAVLRRQSLLGDTVSHSALPGIALAFLLTGTKTSLVLLIGAALAGWMGTLLVMYIIRNSRIKSDSGLGLILSVFFGIGLVLLTLIQKMPNSRQAGLETFLFGQASALVESDLILMGVVGLIIMIVLIALWKEFKLVSFDADYGFSLGLPIRSIDIALTTILVIAIVLGLQTVGVVLMSAMVVAPAAAARQWTDRLGLMIFLSGTFGALAGISGAVISSLTTRMPTGPTIVLSVSIIFLASLMLAPNRGLIWNWSQRRKNRRRLALDAVLLDLYELAEQHQDRMHPHSVSALRAMSFRQSGVINSLKILSEKELVRQIDSESWGLTETGYKQAQQTARSMEKK